MIALNDVLPRFGVREALTEHELKSAIRFVLQHFGHLGHNEIIFAYDFYFSQPDNKGGQSYYGTFTIASLGAILSFYNKKREAIKAGLIKEAAKMEEEERKKQEHDRRQKQFEEDLPLMIEAAKDFFNHYVFIPLELYEAMNKRKPELFPADLKREAWNIAVDQFSQLHVVFPDHFESEKLLMSKEEKLDWSKSSVKRIAKKICFWIAVLEKDILDLDEEYPGTQTQFYSHFKTLRNAKEL
jgi:hypothetical protein